MNDHNNRKDIIKIDKRMYNKLNILYNKSIGDDGDLIDIENFHGEADKLIVEILKELGLNKTANKYEKITKMVYYA